MSDTCGRCGSSVTFEDCWDCGGDGVVGHDCGEDTCCCLYPEDNVRCGTCLGEGSRAVCLSSPEWCEAHPMPGCEKVPRGTVKRPRRFPVTDPDDDAPDGAVVDGYERVDDEWIRTKDNA